MITVLPFLRVIVAIAVSYGVFVAILVAVTWDFGGAATLGSSVRIALSGATILNLVLLFLVYVGWKSIWSTFPALNRWVFPNLNGEWKMIIHWQSAEGSGVAFARARIKQDLLRISMEVFLERLGLGNLDSSTEKRSGIGKPNPLLCLSSCA